MLRTCRTWCFPPMRRWCSTAVRWSRDFGTPNASAKSSISRNVSGLRGGADFLLEEVAQFPATCFQEGAGDCIWDATRGRFWAGYGQRSTRQAADEVAAFFGREVTALELVSPRFYHLDVCFCPLSGGEIFYYPPAFSAASLALIRNVVASEDLIEATDEDAARFNVNAVNINDRLVMASASPHLVARLAERGYRVTEVDLLPFIMSGGGAYCMTLRLDRRSIETDALRLAAE